MEYVPIKDITSEVGDSRYLILGDLHGCFQELANLLAKVEFNSDTDHLICVGDLCDRGPTSDLVLEYLMSLPHFHCCIGNHDSKLLRYLKGSNVKHSNGFDTTLEQIKHFKPEKSQKIREFLESFVHIVKVHDNYVVHAGFNPFRPPEQQTKQDCLFMRYYGGKDYFDNTNGAFWFEHLDDLYPNVFFGHEVFENDIYLRPNIVALDGGCVFGGELRIYDSQTNLVHKYKAHKNYAGTDLPPSERLANSQKNYNDSKESS